MIPPKKSKAAREKVEEDEDHNGTEVADDATTDGGKDVNIFKTEIIGGKRKRELPPAEKFCQTWLLDNFQREDEGEPGLRALYEGFYSEACAEKNEVAIEQHRFKQLAKEAFPKGFSAKENSPYYGMLKVKKSSKKSEGSEKGEKQDDKKEKDGKTEHLKLQDVVEQAIKEFKNPRKGVRFNVLKKYISVHFPVLRVDLRPNILLTWLTREVAFGRIELIRGVGKCGLYRLPGESQEPPEEPKKKKAKAVKKEDSGDKENKEDGEDGEKDEDKDEEAKNDKKQKKGKSEEDDNKEDDEKKKKKKRRPKSTKRKLDWEIDESFGWGKKSKKSRKRNFVVHSDPQRIEETFPLAMVFMSEPKEATPRKIINYLRQYYDIDNAEAKVHDCLEKGIEKGFFELVSGNIRSGTIRLTVDEYDPGYDDNIAGMVINALVACTEPKQCSAFLLKKYVMDYHEEFKIAEHPYLFKRALERAVKSGQIRQETGIGASGTFRLMETFHPSPRILQGDDEEDDYEQDYGAVDGKDANAGSYIDADAFKDSYKPRPTKRHGLGRRAAAGIDHYHDVPSSRQISAKTVKKENAEVYVKEFLPETFQDAYKPHASKSRSRSMGTFDSLPPLPIRKKKPDVHSGSRQQSTKVAKKVKVEKEPKPESGSESEEEVMLMPTKSPRSAKKSRAPEPQSASESEEEVTPAKSPRSAKKSRAREPESASESEEEVAPTKSPRSARKSRAPEPESESEDEVMPTKRARSAPATKAKSKKKSRK